MLKTIVLLCSLLVTYNLRAATPLQLCQQIYDYFLPKVDFSLDQKISKDAEAFLTSLNWATHKKYVDGYHLGEQRFETDNGSVELILYAGSHKGVLRLGFRFSHDFKNYSETKDRIIALAKKIAPGVSKYEHNFIQYSAKGYNQQTFNEILELGAASFKELNTFGKPALPVNRIPFSVNEAKDATEDTEPKRINPYESPRF